MSSRNKDGTFKKGVSGNKSGRPKQSLSLNVHKSAFKLFTNDLGKIFGIIIEMALDGDDEAMILTRDSIVPALKNDGKISDSYLSNLMGLNCTVARSFPELLKAKRTEIAIKRRNKNERN